jgi:ADP-ribose pyrophosphatase YjhB (NUDIX family)
MTLPRPNTVRVLVRRNDEILLVHSQDFCPNLSPWKLPGGKVEVHESAECAAVRELKEETGLQTKPSDLELIFQVFTSGLVPEKRTSVYQTRQWTEPNKLAWDPEEITEAAWVPLSKLTELYLSRQTVRIMQELQFLP